MLERLKTYPKINLDAPTTALFPVANLECHCHLVAIVQLLVEAFPRMCTKVDVVRQRQWRQQREEQRSQKEHVRFGASACRVRGVLDL